MPYTHVNGQPEYLSDPHRVAALPHIEIPDETDQAIIDGAYRICGRCEGEGVTPIFDGRGELVDDTDCRYCYGTGYQVPFADVRLVGPDGSVMVPSRFDTPAVTYATTYAAA